MMYCIKITVDNKFYISKLNMIGHNFGEVKLWRVDKYDKNKK